VATWAQYRARAAENLAAADKLASINEHRWALIACFYSAVHSANALMSRVGVNAEDAMDHHRTKRFVDDNHQQISKRYRSLFSIAWSARYLATFTADDDTFRRYRRKAADILDYVDAQGAP